MNKTTLINPGKRLGYSGIYLDLWKGHDIHHLDFENDGHDYMITFYDDTGRKLHSEYTKKDYLNLYWNMIRRSWKPVELLSA